MTTDAQFSIVIASPPERERLVAEVYCDGRLVALVSQERGEGIFDIETPGPNLIESQIVRRVDLVGFQRAIQEACQRLRKEKNAATN